MNDSQSEPIISDVSYVAISVPDLDEAIEFFEANLGLYLAAREKDHAIFELPSRQLLYIYDAAVRELPNTLVGYEVTDLDVAKDRLDKNEVSYITENCIDGVDLIRFIDPDGYEHAFTNTTRVKRSKKTDVNDLQMMDNILWVGHEVQDIARSTQFWDTLMTEQLKLKQTSDLPDFFGGGSEPQDQDPDEFSAFYLLESGRQLELSKGLVEIKDYYEPIVGFGVDPDKYDEVKSKLREKLYLTAIGGFGDLEWAFFYVPGGKLFEIYTLRGWNKFFV